MFVQAIEGEHCCVSEQAPMQRMAAKFKRQNPQQPHKQMSDVTNFADGASFVALLRSR